MPWHWEPCAPRRLAWGWGSSRRVTAAPSQLLQRTLPIHPRPPWAEMLSLGTESGSKRPLSCDSRWGQGSWSKGTFAAQGSPGASLSEDPKPHPPSRISRQPYSCSSPLPPGAQQSLPSPPSLPPFLLGPKLSCHHLQKFFSDPDCLFLKALVYALHISHFFYPGTELHEGRNCVLFIFIFPSASVMS